MNKSLKFPLLAKPSGITLEQHRQNVVSEVRLLSKCYLFSFAKYKSITGKSLGRRLELIAELHDDGKNDVSTTNKWQRACQIDYENFLKWKNLHHGSFQDYSKARPKEAGANLRSAGIRHEFQSLVLHDKKKLPICLQAAIAAHHGKLGHSFGDRWILEGVKKFWKSFQKESNRPMDSKMSFADLVALHYEFAGPRGLLQLADHRASAIEDGESLPDHAAFQYKFPHAEKRTLQKLVDDFWRSDLLIIRAATGAGKTDTALLWASKQIENNRAERLIIAMPTRFTSNALAINMAESLSNTGLYHSSAWFVRFSDRVDAAQIQRKDAQHIHEFARLLQTPVTVCTIDHLLMALTLTREDHHLVTFNLANSCLVIDEADFYDEFTQANIMILLDVLRHWKVPVLFMSASLPDSYLRRYQQVGFDTTTFTEDNSDVNEYKRPRFAIESIQACEIPSDIADLLSQMERKGAGIIYANTVERAIGFQKWFDDRGIETCLYHSRFTEPDKIRKEELLLEMLGHDAWKNGVAKGIAILTQIGEMSINISADFMVSDLCPIDRLIQRTGRLCRFSKNVGTLHLLIPKKNGTIYPAPYGAYDKKMNSWTESDAFKKTKKSIRYTRLYNTEALVTVLNQVYQKDIDFSAMAQANAQTLKEYFQSNWLINSRQIADKDASDVNFWKSRNIPPQETLFIKKPDTSSFSNYLSFQKWKIRNTVEVPVYLAQDARKNHLVDSITVTIREDETTLNIVREGFYSFKRGIDFRLPEPLL